MRNILFLFLIFVALSFSWKENNVAFPTHLQKTIIATLKKTDSLCYYQCYCAISGNPPSYLHTDSAIKKSEKNNLITITEKFILNKNSNRYRLRYYTSSYSDYPNTKYAYLKLKEKDYWNFKLQADTLLGETSVLKLAALELKLRPLTETYFNVVNNNYPQIILNGKKISEQRMVEGNYLIRKEMEELKKYSY